DRPRPRSRPRAMILPQVFYPVAGQVALLVGMAFVAPTLTEALFGAAKRWVADEAGWFTVLAVAGFLVFVVAVAASRMGRIKLGPDHSEPDYSYPTWFSMLFAAGMGIGLMYFGVAEPVMHFSAPPVGDPGTVAAARQAMRITFFHWGLHAWAVYAVVALALAYFAYRHGLPLRIRSALYPLIGERIHGWIGHTVDAFAVLGTIFGLATSLGLGVIQINSGLNYLFDVRIGTAVQVALIAGITLLATLSVFSGLDRGVRRLSEFNMLLAIALLLFVMLTGPTIHLLQALVQNTGMYVSNVFAMTFNLYAYEPTGWIGGWTLFYWGWWIAWSPFVGMFIAGMSRGRTIREFVVGVLLGWCGPGVAVHGHFPRPQLARAHHPGIRGRRADGADGPHLPVADGVRQQRAAHDPVRGRQRAGRGGVRRQLGGAVPVPGGAAAGHAHQCGGDRAGDGVLHHFGRPGRAGDRHAVIEGRRGIAGVAADLLVGAGRRDRHRPAGRGRAERAAGRGDRRGAAVHRGDDPGLRGHAARDAPGRGQARGRARRA